VSPERLRAASAAALAAALASGHPIEPRALVGSYRGVSLGLPDWVDRLAWKEFRKEFWEGVAGVEGHNVRIEGVREPVTFGPFVVRELPSGEPFGCRAGVLLDYGPTHPRWHPLGRLRDPLVALEPGSVRLLLGASYLQLGASLRTPSFFLLEREESPDDRRSE
jgi:hypothetical protein